jgi:predicted ATPase
MTTSIQAIRLQNIRGFSDTSLDLDRNKTVFVGENNAGKSSLLLILDWIFNRLQMTELEAASPCTESIEILRPARETGKQARRIEIRVQIDDGRTRNRFKEGAVEDNLILLRINYRKGNNELFVKLGPPKRSEIPESDARAISLIKHLREKTSFTYIPSFRDADSGRFNSTLTKAFRTKLEDKVQHDRQGGAPIEYRNVKQALDKLDGVSTRLVQPVLDSLKDFLPKHLFQEARAVLDLDQKDAIDWLLGNLSLELTTGHHDKNMVKKNAVGSGLQSMLDIALHFPDLAEQGKTNYLAIDEPEAFLHPSAQRDLAALIDERVSEGMRLLITTHSPVIIEETSFQDIVISAGRKFFPSRTENEGRDEINTALLAGHHAEMLFCKSVLLVEGEGDRLFFEALRRRIAHVDRSGACSRMSVVPVGSNTQFIPTAKLLRSFEASGMAPIKWCIVTDADTSSEMNRILADTGYEPNNQELSNLLGEMTAALTGANVEDWLRKTRKCNEYLAKNKLPVIFLEADLEYAALSDERSISWVAKKIGYTDKPTKNELLKRLGSKGVDCTAKKDAFKAPWLRGFIGANISTKRLSKNVRDVLQKWGAAASRDFDIELFLRDGKAL